MITFSEMAATVTIWAMTAAGIFFGLRSVYRKRKRAGQVR
jgi:hypothetical protein